MEAVKNKAKYLQLQEMFGGKWKYNRHGYLWECDDDRTVQMVSSCSCDGNCRCTPRYYLYGGKDGTKEVVFNMQSFRLCPGMPF